MSEFVTNPCGKKWQGDEGKDHECILPEDHGLTCCCDCGYQKWFGKPLPMKFQKRKGR